MMDHKEKRLYLFCILMFVFGTKIRLNARDYFFENIEWTTTLTENYKFENGVYCESTCDINEKWTEKKGNYKIYEENTYTVAEIQFVDYKSKYYIFSADEKHLIMYDSYRKKQIECTNSKYHVDEPWIWAVSQCSATSYLTEDLKSGHIEYAPENLENKDISKNWVEGVDGNGEGEILTIKNDIISAKRFYIVNGFFYPNKTSLFYSNGRVKKLLVKCLDSKKKICKEIDLLLEDSGKLQVIDVGEKYSYLILQILEVYPGLKYQDTAISSIFIDGLSSLER